MAPLLPIPGRLGLFTSQQCVDSQAQGSTGFQVTRFSRVPSLPTVMASQEDPARKTWAVPSMCRGKEKSPRELKVLQKIGRCLVGGGRSRTPLGRCGGG